jgi:hypothetical protein
LNKIILRKTNNAIFLAAILVAGTITAFFPSFMVGTAQAVPYPDMDREKKADKKSVSVSSLKCNNINVNVNGLELDVFPQFLGGEVAATAAEGQTEANSFANNGDGSQINDFRFICINNNNNTVIEEEEPIPPTPLTPCEECFSDLTEEQISEILRIERQLSLGNYCDFLQNTEDGFEETAGVEGSLRAAGATETQIRNILDCLADLELIEFPIE